MPRSSVNVQPGRNRRRPEWITTPTAGNAPGRCTKWLSALAGQPFDPLLREFLDKFYTHPDRREAMLASG